MSGGNAWGKVQVPDTDSGKFNQSVQEVGGELLVISQFALYGDCRKGRRPSFDRAAIPEKAEALYEQFVAKLRQSGLQVEMGRFGAVTAILILALCFHTENCWRSDAGFD